MKKSVPEFCEKVAEAKRGADLAGGSFDGISSAYGD